MLGFAWIPGTRYLPEVETDQLSLLQTLGTETLTLEFARFPLPVRTVGFAIPWQL